MDFEVSRFAVVAAVAGVVHAAIVLYVHFVALPVSSGGDPSTASVVAGNALAILGLFLVGAVATYLLVRHGLVIAMALTIWLTWNSVSDVVVGQGMEPYTTFYDNTITLAIALVLAVGVGTIGIVVRDRFGLLVPSPSVQSTASSSTWRRPVSLLSPIDGQNLSPLGSYGDVCDEIRSRSWRNCSTASAARSKKE